VNIRLRVTVKTELEILLFIGRSPEPRGFYHNSPALLSGMAPDGLPGGLILAKNGEKIRWGKIAGRSLYGAEASGN
jgi:hypothetical protein